MRTLKRDIGLLDVFCISSGAMISSGLFVLPAVAYSLTGPSVIVSYLFASLLLLPILFSKIELATAMPKSGGSYFYIDRSMGPLMGMIGGLFGWLSLTFKVAFALLGIGILGTIFNISIFHTKLIAVMFCVIFTVINILGVKTTAKTQNIIVLALIGLLLLYIIAGMIFIQWDNFVPFTPYGIKPIFATTGLVFISFSGVTKVASVAEEIKHPERNIPRGLFLSWGLISLIYILVVFVTVGVTSPDTIKTTLTPILACAGISMGLFGVIVMGIAAVLAFVSTANAGLLTASRVPMAMSKDEFIPSIFAKLSKNRIPIYSTLSTSLIMIFIILFLDLKIFVEIASTMVIFLFLLCILSVIIMRESKIRHYRPKFKSPFYPWLQISGILGCVFLIIEIGSLSIMSIGILMLVGVIWYQVYASNKIKREYGLLYAVKRILDNRLGEYTLDEELREILIERDNITMDRFIHLLKKSVIIDFKTTPSLKEFTSTIVHALSQRTELKEKPLYELLLKREKDTSVMIKPGVIVPSVVIPGYKHTVLILVRCMNGIIVSDDEPPTKTAIIVASTKDERHFYLHTLMWLMQIVEDDEFDTRWFNAKDENEMRNVIIDIWEKITSSNDKNI